MIGGIDIAIPTRAADMAVEVAVRAIRQFWPSAVFENGITGEGYNHFQEIPFGMIEELFVYRDDAAREQWDQQGAVPDDSNTMIHLVRDSDQITAVIDEKDDAMGRILGAIRSGLSDEIFNFPTRGAA